ncbi:hypothetical protein OHA21_49735 [Actinoplanes sp. NBC_00393]|uniref:DUF7144 family membrane protein n=1 Tax=Actinoplanes sp. NBC_00393 TaxID=2975953 RepID=UPI002E243EDF
MQVEESRATGWIAWVLFGGIILVLLGTLHFCLGLIALISPEVLAGTRADQLLPVSLTALAWLHLVLGAVAVVTGVGLVRGLTWARVLAIVIGCVAALVNFAFHHVHPVWSVLAIALATVVVYSVAAHGRELADAYGS